MNSENNKVIPHFLKNSYFPLALIPPCRVAFFVRERRGLGGCLLDTTQTLPIKNHKI